MELTVSKRVMLLLLVALMVLTVLLAATGCGSKVEKRTDPDQESIDADLCGGGGALEEGPEPGVGDGSTAGC